MKKALWFIVSVVTFFCTILYLGNVFVIGDHFGNLFLSIGFPAAATRWLIVAWDILVGISPLIILSWCVAKSILGYGELNVDALRRSQDERVIFRAMKGIAEQPESIESTLDKYDLRQKCNELLESGNHISIKDFLDDYYSKCEGDTRIVTNKYAVLAAVSVVLSPKSAGDTLALLVWQCRIISSTLKIYGGRPSKKMVFRLYAKVLMHAFVAGSIDEVFDQFAFGAVDTKMLSFLTQAIAAVATCIRTGSLTRYYINHGLECDRREALKVAVQDVSKGVVDVIQSKELKTAVKQCLNCGIDIGKTVAQEAGKQAISIFLRNEDDSGNAAEQKSDPNQQV